MKKLSEYQDEEALDLLSDIVEPAYEIMQDEAVRAAFKAEKKKMPKVVKAIVKGHKDAIMDILARLEGMERSEYHCNVFTLPAKAMEILSDQQLLDFFLNAAGGTAKESSSSATEITMETESE